MGVNGITACVVGAGVADGTRVAVARVVGVACGLDPPPQAAARTAKKRNGTRIRVVTRIYHLFNTALVREGLKTLPYVLRNGLGSVVRPRVPPLISPRTHAN
jgi:hypothetical protein